VTIRVLQQQGEPASVTARRFGLSEGTVRYHRRRGRDGFAVGGPDGRAKVHLIQQRGLVEAVDQWWSAQQAERPERPPSVTQLLGYLQSEFGYPGSYKSVRLYVRKRFPPPRRRPYRRIETPPGAQAQTDWAEQVLVDIGDPAGPTVLHALVMTLSHSRKQAVIWSGGCVRRCACRACRRVRRWRASTSRSSLRWSAAGSRAWPRVNGSGRTVHYYCLARRGADSDGCADIGSPTACTPCGGPRMVDRGGRFYAAAPGSGAKRASY